MTELSPAAQTVNSAYRAGGLAAALRAVAKLEDIEPGFIGPCDESYGSYLHSCSITQRDFNYSLALEKNRAQVAAERKLLAIAAELKAPLITFTSSLPMTQHPISPPPELVEKWNNLPLSTQEIIAIAWRNGADTELEACCEWFVRNWTDVETADKLRAARRPSLKEEALLKLKELQALLQFENVDSSCIRQALEQLPDIKWSLPR